MENTQICVIVYFQFYHFPKSKIDSESRFEKRMSISIQFFKSVLINIKKSKKMDLPLFFQKVIWAA